MAVASAESPEHSDAAAPSSGVAYHGGMEQSRPGRLTRSNDRILGGVAAGISEYIDVDPTIVRVGWVLAIIFGLPLGILGYFILWVIMPAPAAGSHDDLAASGPSEAYSAGRSTRDNGALILGALLIVVGAVFLLPDIHIFPWFSWRLIHLAWPVLLIGGGILLLMRSGRSTS